MVNSVDWCLANGCFICLQQPVDKNDLPVSQSLKDGFISERVKQLSLKLYMSERAEHNIYIGKGSVMVTKNFFFKTWRIIKVKTHMVQSCFINAKVCIA